jgi:hypothetical protein
MATRNITLENGSTEAKLINSMAAIAPAIAPFPAPSRKPDSVVCPLIAPAIDPTIDPPKVHNTLFSVTYINIINI